jgi:hypothetical protein
VTACALNNKGVGSSAAAFWVVHLLAAQRLIQTFNIQLFHFLMTEYAKHAVIRHFFNLTRAHFELSRQLMQKFSESATNDFCVCLSCGFASQIHFFFFFALHMSKVEIESDIQNDVLFELKEHAEEFRLIDARLDELKDIYDCRMKLSKFNRRQHRRTEYLGKHYHTMTFEQLANNCDWITKQAIEGTCGLQSIKDHVGFQKAKKCDLVMYYCKDGLAPAHAAHVESPVYFANAAAYIRGMTNKTNQDRCVAILMNAIPYYKTAHE